MEVSSASGVLTLSIPIKGGRSVKLLYGEVEIDYKEDWQDNHFKTLKTVYGNAPFFQFYEPAIDDLYNNKIERLFDWNILCLETFLRLSKMSNMIHFSLNTPMEDSRIKNVPNPGGEQISTLDFPPYQQVFSERTGFMPNLSCLDLLMNLGPDTQKYIQDLTNKPD